jgi:hypothetical protein
MTEYYFGASLKDLDKKWFAFSEMDIGVGEMMKSLESRDDKCEACIGEKGRFNASSSWIDILDCPLFHGWAGHQILCKSLWSLHDNRGTLLLYFY